MTRMTPDEANKKPSVIIRVMGSDAVQIDGMSCGNLSGMKFAIISYDSDRETTDLRH